jgi:DhnA family fructose-bisphosphate aldolase class Ia
MKITVPLGVPLEVEDIYIRNYQMMTKETGRLMLFAGDQKVEHLNDDFYGENIHIDDAGPEHLFKIATKAKIGVFATQLGLVSLYGRDYPDVPYLVKLNSKTNLIKTNQVDPISKQWIDIEQIIQFKKQSGLRIVGVGYTIYLGSEYENLMLREAAQMIYKAHQNGLITVLWIYPRGKAVKDEKDPHLIAGAAGVGACLGSDFVKVNYPKQQEKESKEVFKEAIMAAGRTKVLCAGGPSVDVKAFLQRLHDQIFISGAAGNATGRNIHQKSIEEAIRMCNAISAITYKGMEAEEAMLIYKGKKELFI